MHRKQSEADFANLMNRLREQHNGDFWTHKWADMRVCPNCHQKLYKTENNVDYTIIVGNVACLVECKQGEDRFPWADEKEGIRPGQREWLSEWAIHSRPSWLFLELGDGAVPKGRNAWMIPWYVWLQIETILEERGMKSLPWKRTRQSGEFNAVEMLDSFQLTWVPTVGFVIPEGHIFWTIFAKQVTYIPE